MTTLLDLHAAIEADLLEAASAHFGPDLPVTIQRYFRETGESLPTPALLLELADLLPDEDATSDGGATLDARFRVTIVLDANTFYADQPAEFTARLACLALWHKLHQRRRYAGCGQIILAAMGEAQSAGADRLHAYTTWEIEFGMTIPAGPPADLLRPDPLAPDAPPAQVASPYD